MEVKEAIEFLEVKIFLQGKAKDYEAIVVDIISLLQQGEKYRQQDLKTIQFYIRYYNIWNVLKANTDKKTIDYMERLEQKYFSKEVKKNED